MILSKDLTSNGGFWGLGCKSEAKLAAGRNSVYCSTWKSNGQEKKNFEPSGKASLLSRSHIPGGDSAVGRFGESAHQPFPWVDLGSPGAVRGSGSQLGKVLCHGSALAGGRDQEVAAPAAPSSILGHGHGSCPQHLLGPVCVLLCDLSSFPCPNLSHHLPTAAPAGPCHWNPFPVADLCFVPPLLIRMGLTRLSKRAVKTEPAVEMSELAGAGDVFGGALPAPRSGAEPQRWVPSSDPALFPSA